jgi:hypothetical protein
VIASATTGGVLLDIGGNEIRLEGTFAASQVRASLVGSDTVITFSQVSSGLAANLGESGSLVAESWARLTLTDQVANGIANSAVL